MLKFNVPKYKFIKSGDGVGVGDLNTDLDRQELDDDARIEVL